MRGSWEARQVLIRRPPSNCQVFDRYLSHIFGIWWQGAFSGTGFIMWVLVFLGLTPTG
jgi:hypothetical protein